MSRRIPTAVDHGDDNVIDRLSKVLNTMSAFSLAVGDVAEAATVTRDWAVATRERAARAEQRNADLEAKITSLLTKQTALEKELAAAKAATEAVS